MTNYLHFFQWYSTQTTACDGKLSQTVDGVAFAGTTNFNGDEVLGWKEAARSSALESFSEAGFSQLAESVAWSKMKLRLCEKNHNNQI